MKRKIKGLVSPKIKMYMARDGITQKDLAKKLGIGAATLNAKINGKRIWTIEEAIQLAKIFKTTLDDLFLDTVFPNENKKKASGED